MSLGSRCLLHVLPTKSSHLDRKWKCLSLSCVQFFVTPWTVANQAPLSMEFSRQEYWTGMPFPSPGDLPDPEIKPASLASCISYISRQVLYHLRLLSESSQKEVEPPNWNWTSGSPLSNSSAEETLTLSHSNKATLSTEATWQQQQHHKQKSYNTTEKQ